MKNRLFHWTLLLTAWVGLTGCGKDFCIGPFGDCGQTQSGNGGSGGGGGPVGVGLRMVFENQYRPFQEFTAGTTLSIQAQGGVGPYQWVILDGPDAEITNPAPISVDNPTVQGNIISFKVGSAGTRARLQLTDTGGNPANNVFIGCIGARN